MLVIRTEQLKEFSPKTEDELVGRILIHLRHKHRIVVQGARDPELKPMVEAALARGKLYGFSDPVTLTKYVVLMFICAPNFDDHPKVAAILTDPALPPDSRCDALLKGTTDKDWIEVRENYDTGAWFVKPKHFAATEDRPMEYE